MDMSSHKVVTQFFYLELIFVCCTPVKVTKDILAEV